MPILEPDLEFYFRHMGVAGYIVEVRLYPYLDGFLGEFYSLELMKEHVEALLQFLMTCQQEKLELLVDDNITPKKRFFLSLNSQTKFHRPVKWTLV